MSEWTLPLIEEPVVSERDIPACHLCGSKGCGDTCRNVVSITDWHGRGRCTRDDVELFFPPEGSSPVWPTREAKKICETCPVVAQCLEYALEQRIDHGVWGGLTPRERRDRRSQLLALLKKRREDEKRLDSIR